MDMNLEVDDIGIVFEALSDLELRENRDTLVERVNRDASDFESTVSIALSGRQPLAWHAAWIVTHAMRPNDKRLKHRTAEIIDRIPNQDDGFQCELLRIVDKLDITSDLEGQLFEDCLAIWQDVQKKPGVRMFAFRQICRIVDTHPELKPELAFVTEQHYLDPLSPGIRRSVRRLIGRTLEES